MSCRLALSRIAGQVSRFFGDETSPCGGSPVDHARRRWRAKILARAVRAEADRAGWTAHRLLNKLEPVEIGPRGRLILDTHRLRAYVPRVRAALRGRFCIYAPASRTAIRGCRPEGEEEGAFLATTNRSEDTRCRNALRRSTSSIPAWARTSGAARRAPSTAASTAPASTASAAR